MLQTEELTPKASFKGKVHNFLFILSWELCVIKKKKTNKKDFGTGYAHQGITAMFQTNLKVKFQGTGAAVNNIYSQDTLYWEART